MTPTEMAMMRQQMVQGMSGQFGQPGGFDQLRQNLQSMRSSMPQMQMPQHEQRPMDMERGRNGHQQFGGPNASPMSRMFPGMGMPEGMASNVAVTPMNGGPGSGAEGGRFLSGQRDLPAMKAVGK